MRIRILRVMEYEGEAEWVLSSLKKRSVITILRTVLIEE
jgi:hypothetical protein